MKLNFTLSFFIGIILLAQHNKKEPNPVHSQDKEVAYRNIYLISLLGGSVHKIPAIETPKKDPVFATTVETLQSGCIVLDEDFNLGETICGRITSDIFPSLKFRWDDPAGFSRREGVALVSSPQTDSWTLPSSMTTEISPGLFIDNRGTWKLNAALIPSGVQANIFFRVHDPANPLADLVLNSTASPDPVTAGSNVSFFFYASQNGPDAAQNVTFTATLPQHTTFVALNAPAGWTVNAPSGGTVTATRATWAAFPLNAPPGPDIFELVVTAIGGTINNTPIASAGSVFSTTPDRQAYSNRASAQVYTASGTSGPAIQPVSAGLLTESCVAPNGAIDPGETVTVTFEVRNIGNAAANNVVGTLLPVNGVTNPPAPVSFGNIAPGTNVTRDITFIADPAAPCGSGIIPMIHFTSDPTSANRGTAVFQRLNMLSNPGGPSNIPNCCSGAPSCTITCPANITVSNDPNQCGAVVTYAAPTTTGTCGTVTTSPNSGSFFPVGTTTVTATTSAGPTCSFTVTVNDTQPPSISCPSNITVPAAGGSCGAVVNYPAPTVSDNCPGVTFAGSPLSGSTFPIGTTTVTLTATDASGNTATCSFTVTVTDNQLPTITCPSNITASAGPGICTASVVNPNPTTNDNCGIVTQTWAMTGATTATSPATGIQTVGTATFNSGTTTVTYTVRDAANNTATCNYTVTVTDNQPPSVTCPGNMTASNAAGSCFASVATPAPTNSDNCGVTVRTWALTGATVATSPATGIQSVGTRNFNVGVTTVTYTVRDAANNTATCSFTVTVNDVQAPVVTCPANITASNSPNNCFASVATPAPTNSDNCAVTRRTWTLTGATTGSSPATGINSVGTTNFNVGVTTVTYTVADAANNTATCSFTVTVNDVQAPSITCPSNITTTTPVGSCTAIVNYTINATDNCPGVTTTMLAGQASGTAFPIGTTTVTWRATDAAGNTAQCSFTITVIDAQLPVITQQPVSQTKCVGDNVTFAVAGTNATYQWQQFTGGSWNNIPGATANTYTVNNVTTAMNTNSFRVNLIGLCTTVTSNIATLFVNTLPIITLSSSGPPSLLPGQFITLTANGIPPGGSFVWLLNGSAMPGVTGSTLSNIGVDNQGVYQVRYTDPNGCVTTSSSITVSGASSPGIWVFPNPNFGQFQVKFFNQNNESVSILVYNYLGGKVYEKRVTLGLTYSTIDIDLGPSAANGVYIVELVNSAGKKVGATQILVRP